MPYKVKGQCVYKKDTGKKVGCTTGSVKKYLAALHANVDEANINENLNYQDMFNKEYLLLRIPFLKDYNFFERKNGIEAQRVVYHENVQKLYKGDIINFKQFNVSSEFVFYTHKVNDATFYNFIIKNKFYPMVEDKTLDPLEERVLMLVIKSIGDKLSYSEELMVKDNQSIDENKLDEIFNKINETLFKVEEESKSNDTPLFESDKLKGGKADKMTAKDIANKFKVSVDKIEAQIKKGVKIEMEHTDDKKRATEIAMDHITEFPDYYDKLIKMEKKAEKELKENVITNNNISETNWAIFKINNGQKCYITKLNKNGGIEECNFELKYSNKLVLKFDLENAKKIIKKNIRVDEKLGIVNAKGVQHLYDWNIKYEPVKESQRKLIKRLLREEIEEGSLARTLGTLSMAASTLASPNMQAMNKDPYKIEKTDKIGVTKNADGSITSIAKTDGPTKEIAKELAINKAKLQIVSTLNLSSIEFNFEVVDVKFEKGKNNVICIVQIIAKI